METEMRVSVRTLVEFLLRSGDLDNRIPAASEEIMREGSRMHRRLQKQAGPDYQSEVFLQTRWEYEDTDLTVLVEGRADGVYMGSLPAVPGSETAPVIDEIKTSYRNLESMKTPEPVHLAQARCYAYMLCAKEGHPFVYIRMTYCNLETEDIHYFYEKMSAEDLREFFGALMKEYRKWAEHVIGWKREAIGSIKEAAFPFPYREGQKELAAGVYKTISRGKKLYLEAPTGTGKTMSTVFPAIKAIGEGKAEKLFYLTARTTHGQVAEEAIGILRSKGLRFKTVSLTAKDKICALGAPECNPEACPRAKGHYDRINKALYDLLIHEDDYSRDVIVAYAEKHEVCPFELSLDLTLFADGIICDYNYVFDPHVYLRRFFGEGMQHGPYLFLVDEAHNLVERGRSMYSASMTIAAMLALRAKTEKRYPGLGDKLTACAGRLYALREIAEARLRREDGEVDSLFERHTFKSSYVSFEVHEIEETVAAMQSLHGEISNLLEKERKLARRRKRKPSKQRKEMQEKILEFYFELSHFLLIFELFDEHYRIYSENVGGTFVLRLFCMDPGKNLKLCMDRGVSSILFSATLLPIQYYKQLLGGTEEDYEVYAHSVFDPEKRAIVVANDVTSRYSRRNDREYEKIAAYIAALIGGRHGNYMVFFPSYAFMNKVYEVFGEKFRNFEEVDCILQTEKMKEEEREAFLSRFEEVSDERTLLGFCVLGGIFSEGIDLKDDRLIGAIVVGTGIPQVCSERELLKRYFDETGVDGYDYAYRYPGMNKVAQAAGRVIRTKDDVGIVGLLDDRFLSPSYLSIFPREWENLREAGVGEVPRIVDRFWDEWL